MSVNKVILIGRLGGDPEMRFTSGGKSVCNFSLATDESFRGQDGTQQKKCEWHRVVIWDKLAEMAQSYLHKGDRVYIEGRIATRKWQDKDQQERTSFEIIAATFRSLETKKESGIAAAAGDLAEGESAPF